MKKPITKRGYDFLRQEVIRLKGTRPELANAIEVARAHGDLSENAEYDAAKERSGMIEAKIREMESSLANSEVIDTSKIKGFDKVVFGTTVTLEDLDSGEQRVLSIVGAPESDTKKGLISFESPIARALISKEPGDVVKVRAPGGLREYEVLEVGPIDFGSEDSDISSVA